MGADHGQGAYSVLKLVIVIIGYFDKDMTDSPGDDSENGSSALAEDLFLVKEGAVPSRSTPPLPPPPPPQHMLPMAARSEEAAACHK